ncbi:hypothetical protein LY90DRAFT_500566 [Neocallimastix californiae]|uniref:SAM domain-containing protein n=1 Tax=Neocallimastix californiae TaxID=1754190 RepID=A0A1Y2F8J0_9FUNG|nr:hypothetical protein LY90DRAFT_500566 [Neocallimastix californiae]|eukprot:ORY80183.1 hypothetical protein LY90DRAFT_500566 [Neocallimastix californiae]
MEHNMDNVITSTFCLPIRAHRGIQTNGLDMQQYITDIINQLCEDSIKKYKCQIVFSQLETSPTISNLRAKNDYFDFNYSISINGPLNQVLQARGNILRNSPSQTVSTLYIERWLLLNKNEEIKLSINEKLKEIMQQTNATIVIDYNKNDKVKPPPGLGSDSIKIDILGQWENVERARLKCLVYFDELCGFTVCYVEIDPKLHYILAGRKRETLNEIMNETSTNIYIPFPLINHSGLKAHSVVVGDPPINNNQSDSYSQSIIYITGSNQDQVNVAKKELLNLAINKKLSVASRQVKCIPRKIDWMLISKRDALKKIMQDNATFIEFPPIGSSDDTIFVYGDERVFVERTIRSIMLLACSYYKATIKLLHPIPFPQSNVISNQSMNNKGMLQNNIQQLNSTLKQLCQITRAEIIFSNQFVKIYGLESAVKNAYRQLMESSLLKTHTQESIFQLELALEQRDYINGKKNGKINKIIKSSGCKITFQDYNRYNMLIDLCNQHSAKALEGLAMLEDEIPAELSFYIPESFHKRIIGVGGKNIQRIMKKFGVYVKFSNAEEFKELGGYFENNDNVIARTPSKNSANLESLKQAILELVNPNKEKKDITITTRIPRQFHSYVTGKNAYNINNIEKEYKVKINFPEKESGSTDIEIIGSESQVNKARYALQELIPEVYDIHINNTNIVKNIINSEEFNENVISQLNKYDMKLFYYLPEINENENECTIILQYKKGSPDFEKARKLVKDYFIVNTDSADIYHISRVNSYSSLSSQRKSTESLSSLININSNQSSALPSNIGPSINPNPISQNQVNIFGEISNKIPGRIIEDEKNDKMHTSLASMDSKITYSDYSLFDNNVIYSFELPFKNTRAVGSAPNLRTFFDDNVIIGNSNLQRSQSDINNDLPIPEQTINKDNDNNLWSKQTQPRYNGIPMYSQTSIENPQGIFAQTPDHYMQAAPGSGIPVMTSKHQDQNAEHEHDEHYRPENKLRKPSPLRNATSTDIILDDEESETEMLSEKMMQQIISSNGNESSDIQQISYILISIGLQRYIPKFVEQEIDYKTFITLTDNDLKEIGIMTLGSRKKILSTIEELHNSMNSNSRSPIPPLQAQIDTNSSIINNKKLNPPLLPIQNPMNTMGNPLSIGQGLNQSQASHIPLPFIPQSNSIGPSHLASISSKTNNSNVLSH